MDRKIDAENLIATIKRHEAIWNKNKKIYHRKISKESSWNQVCEEIVDGWNDLNEKEKTYRQGELKKRWNNIRDYYKKDLTLQINGSIGQPTMKRSKYIFSKHLEFLRPFLERSRTYEKEKAVSDDETEIYIEENFSSSDSETSHLLKRKNAIKLFEDSKILEENTEPVIANVATTNTGSTEEEDSDLLFLKSLIPDMKLMNYSQKIDFKMGILKLHKNIMFGHPEEECELDSKNPLI